MPKKKPGQKNRTPKGRIPNLGGIKVDDALLDRIEECVPLAHSRMDTATPSWSEMVRRIIATGCVALEAGDRMGKDYGDTLRWLEEAQG